MPPERKRDEGKECGDGQGCDRLDEADAAEDDRPDAAAEHPERQKAEEDRAERLSVPHGYCFT